MSKTTKSGVVVGSAITAAAGVIGAVVYLGTRPPRSDATGPAAPLAPWVRLDQVRLGKPVGAARAQHPVLGEALVIPATATPAIATRIAHEAANLQLAVCDRRFSPERWYVTVALPAGDE